MAMQLLSAKYLPGDVHEHQPQHRHRPCCKQGGANGSVRKGDPSVSSARNLILRLPKLVHSSLLCTLLCTKSQRQVLKYAGPSKPMQPSPDLTHSQPSTRGKEGSSHGGKTLHSCLERLTNTIRKLLCVLAQIVV